jgi:hypothetical protein
MSKFSIETGRLAFRLLPTPKHQRKMPRVRLLKTRSTVTSLYLTLVRNTFLSTMCNRRLLELCPPRLAGFRFANIRGNDIAPVLSRQRRIC